mmetsp:Transcript_15932/g.17358  ORF Transcript_15932/g.17358 Transcript_15932/m.17358 type:complete len:255 (-) Transcript_15932:75-839(-)
MLHFVGDGLAIDVVPLLLQGLQDLRLLGVLLPATLTAQGDVLFLELGDLLLELLDFGAQFVVVLEQGEVGVLGIDEVLHQLIDVADSRGCLDPSESFLVTGDLILVGGHGHKGLGGMPGVLGDLFLVLVILFAFTIFLVSPYLGSHEFLHALVVLDEATQLSPLLLKLCVLFIGLLLQRGHLRLSRVSGLVGGIGLLDDVCHLFLLLLQLVFQFAVNVIENHAFSPQGVDLLTQVSVGCNRFIELLQALVKAVL